MQPLPLRVAVPDEGYHRGLVACQAACPVHTDARGYVRAIAEGRFEEAYLIARGPNPFASICGRICGAPARPPAGAARSRASMRRLLRRARSADRHPRTQAHACERPGRKSVRRWRWRAPRSATRRSPAPTPTRSRPSSASRSKGSSARQQRAGRDHRRRAGWPLGRARPRAARVPPGRLRSRTGRGRDARARRAGLPPPPRADPPRDRRHRGARRRDPLQRPRRPGRDVRRAAP
jgi:hypothetical protein